MTAPTVVEVLQKARALITPRRKWAAKGWGRRGSGRYCAIHAICHVQGSNCEGGEAQEIFQKVVGCYGGDFNDTHTHAEVLAAIDKAIELAKAEG